MTETYRDENDKQPSRALANLSHLPLPQVEAMRAILAGKQLVPLAEACKIQR